LRKWKFDAFDRHLGMILGGLEGAFLGVVATLFVISLAPRTRETILTSSTGTAVNRDMTAIGLILPGEIRVVLSPFDPPSDPIGPTFERVEAAPIPRTGRGRDETAEPATLDDFYEEGRSRVGRAVLDTAEQELRRARAQGGRTAGAADEELEPATLNDLYRESRSRVGRAILDSAEQELQRARGANDGTVKRR